jgi:hypothetical protein
MSDLSLVQGDDHNEKADTETRKPSTSPEVMYRLCAGLKATTENEYKRSDDDGPSASKFISTLQIISWLSKSDRHIVTHGSSKSGSTEGTSSEERNNNSTGTG